VVDDYPDSAESAVLLDFNGYETRVASTVAAALKVAASFAPDVVLVDIGLPDGDGYELAAKRRALLDPAPRFVTVTGFTHLDERSKLAGFDAHLLKPVEPSALLEVLDRLTGRRAGG
jgi:CheY-like chemotaxis protein